MYLQRCKGLFGSSFLLPFFVLVFLFFFFIFISNFFFRLSSFAFSMLHSAMLWLFCALCIHICAAISLFVRALKSIFICLRLHWNVRCTYLCSHTHTNINGCCLLAERVCRLPFGSYCYSFPFHFIPFDYHSFWLGWYHKFASYWPHHFFSSRFVLQQFYYSTYNFYFLHIESENMVCCVAFCVVLFLSFIFLLFFWSGLSSWIVSVHCGHRSLYIPRLSSCIWVRVFYVRSFQQLNRKCVPSGSSTAYFIQHNTRDVL